MELAEEEKERFRRSRGYIFTAEAHARAWYHKPFQSLSSEQMKAIDEHLCSPTAGAYCAVCGFKPHAGLSPLEA